MDIQYDLFAGVAIVSPANDDLPVIEKIDIREKLNQLELPVGGYGKKSISNAAGENLFSPGIGFETRYGYVQPNPDGIEPLLAPYRARPPEDAAAVYAPYVPLTIDGVQPVEQPWDAPWYRPAGLERGVIPAQNVYDWNPPQAPDIQFTLDRLVNVQMPVVRPIERITLEAVVDRQIQANWELTVEDLI